jgi:hypothetical protein
MRAAVIVLGAIVAAAILLVILSPSFRCELTGGQWVEQSPKSITPYRPSHCENR